MKKSYETPVIEKIAFNYRDQVVAASNGGSCEEEWIAPRIDAFQSCRQVTGYYTK